MDVLNDKEFQLRQEDAVMEPGILQARLLEMRGTAYSLRYQAAVSAPAGGL